MFILPYLYHKSRLGNMIVHEWNLLTISGTKLWAEDKSLRVKEDILDPNGLILLSDIVVNNAVVYCELDGSQLQMDDYYRWEDLTPVILEEVFCWRRFYIFGPVDSPAPIAQLQWLPTPVSQVLDPIICHDLFHYLIHSHSQSHSHSHSQSPSQTSLNA